MTPTPPIPCPQCGGTIPDGAPQGICPRCLLRNAMNPTVVQPDPLRLPEEIVRAFPHLEILQFVGAGGMGRVYKVRQLHLDRVVALKILLPELAGDPAFAERFTREGRALAKLAHPNIVTVFDFGKTGDFYWLLMEYVDGVNLRQAMQTGTLTPREALQIVPMICAALGYAHGQGVLHRDIKPENILIDTLGHVKIADFGVAKMRGEEGSHITLTLSGSALGTPAYMAPEQIERPKDVDHRADIYSLGVVFYEMLTGELPMGRFPAPSEKAGTDPRLDSVVFRTLEKERDRRYQSAGEMKTHVESCTSGPVPSVRRSRERVSHKAVWAFVLVLTGLAGALAILVVAWVNAHQNAPGRLDQAGRIVRQNFSRLDNIPDLTGSSPASGMPTWIPVVGIGPVVLLLTGTILGIFAVRGIRASEGRLGGAVMAVFGAMAVFVILLVSLTSLGLCLVGEDIGRGTGKRPGDLWGLAGAFIGAWVSGLLIGKIYRHTMGRVFEKPGKHSVLSIISICGAVGGGALGLLCFPARPGAWIHPSNLQPLVASALLLLFTGLITGVLSWRETAGKNSAVASGVLFILVAFTCLD